MISGKELFAEISNAQVAEGTEVVGYCVRNSRMELLENLLTTPPADSVPDGLAAAVNRLLDSDGSRGTFSAIRRGDALAEVERLLAAAPVPGGE